MTHLTHHLVLLAATCIVLLVGAPAAGATTTTPAPTRCDIPYDSAGATLVSQRTMRASAPALRWLNAVYGAQAPIRANVLREVAVRPCSLAGRGAITVWSTNPSAMIRRAWRQPWIRSVDIQWVRVRFGSRDAYRAVGGFTMEEFAEAERRLGGPVTTVGDDPAHDCIRLGIHRDAQLPSDADAIGAELLGQPTCSASRPASCSRIHRRSPGDGVRDAP